MTSDEAIELIRSSAIAERADALIRHLRPSARIVVRDEPLDRKAGSSVSQFGGSPSLPAGTPWPVWDRREYQTSEIARLERMFKANPRATGIRDAAARMREELSAGPLPLAFLGQLSLREVQSVAPFSGWPRQGILAFFLEPSQSAWGFDPLCKGHCRVLFVPENGPLAPIPFPEGLPNEARSPERSLTFDCEWTLPSYLELEGDGGEIWRTDEYTQLLERLVHEQETVHRCGGHPQEIQNEMKLECQLVTNGIYCGGQEGYRDPRRAELEKGAVDWVLLAQFDSEEKLGWMWGDVGRVYFWARQQDIVAGDFSNSWAILQCH